MLRASRLNCWKTKPILRLRTAASWSLVQLLDRQAVEEYWPAVGVSRQPSRFISVDLPEPDGPMIATNSPGSMLKLTPRSAWTSMSPIW